MDTNCKEWKKAKGYFEYDFDNDLNAISSDHSKIEGNLNKAGSAINPVGEHEKNLKYFKKALLVFKEKCGNKDPRTKILREIIMRKK